MKRLTLPYPAFLTQRLTGFLKRFTVFKLGFFLTGIVVLLTDNQAFAQRSATLYPVFFADPYQNPAVNSGLDATYGDACLLKPGLTTDMANYVASGAMNVALPESRNNLGVAYQRQSQNVAVKQKLSLNFGRQFSVFDSSRLHLGFSLDWHQYDPLFTKQESIVFPNQFHPRYPWFGPIWESGLKDAVKEPEKQHIFSENLGIWFQNEKYYAGVTVKNFMTLSRTKAPFKENPQYPLGIQGTVTRHLQFQSVTVSPHFAYRYQMREGLLQYGLAPNTAQFHQLQAGLNLRLKDRFYFSNNATFEHIPPYGNTFQFINYRMQAGMKFWDQLLVSCQVRFPESRLFGRYNQQKVWGAGVTWLLPKGLVNGL